MRNKIMAFAAVSILSACKANSGFQESNDFSGFTHLELLRERR